jgi:hypothetical protein
MTRTPVIDKGLDLGLQWAEIGPIFRLPGYRAVSDVFSTAFETRACCAGRITPRRREGAPERVPEAR